MSVTEAAAPPSTMPVPAPDASLCQLLRQLWGHLSCRLQLGVLLLVMLASSAAEVLSLAAVLPFLALLANPAGLWNQPLVQQWAPRLGIASAEALLLADQDFLCLGGCLDPAAEKLASDGNRFRPEL